MWYGQNDIHYLWRLTEDKDEREEKMVADVRALVRQVDKLYGWGMRKFVLLTVARTNASSSTIRYRIMLTSRAALWRSSFFSDVFAKIEPSGEIAHIIHS